MKTDGIDFPRGLTTALRNGELVVFAGAGVSMGPPASLPSFCKLTKLIARGAGRDRQNSETEDQFLGSLKDGGTDVHQLAAEVLGKEDLEPTELHRDLLRLYANRNDLKIVTTNFDVLFERAVAEVFLDVQPEVFRSPALPLGRSFQGIVHIHGSVTQPDQMVLTDQNFGHAYLTDGWATRFLIDLFDTYTVLFIGYSHDDTIMRYLGRSLPPSSNRRYSLIGEMNGDPARWQSIGVEPIQFRQSHNNDYSALNGGISRLANLAQYGGLDWQREISNVAQLPPPIDNESVSLIEEALNEEWKTRIFIEAADSPDWIEWLD